MARAATRQSLSTLAIIVVAYTLRRDWLQRQQPGSRLRLQALHKGGSKWYDVLSYGTADGQTRQVCFDITAFYGRF